MTARVPLSSRGYSLVEVLVSLAVLSLAMGAAYSSLITQTRSHATQTMVSETLHAGRLAFDRVTEQIGMAGFGVPEATTPSAAPVIVTAKPAQLTFWANVSSVHSYLTTNLTKGATLLRVVSAAGFKAGTQVYVTDATRWHLGTVRSVSGTTIRLTSGLTYNFTAGSRVTPVAQVTFDWVGGALRRNGRVFIPKVTNLTFTYDSPVLSNIRVVTISMTVETRSADVASRAPRTVTLGARVVPPNLTL